jgi:phosphoglycerate dehydrogenase-like enzyme
MVSNIPSDATGNAKACAEHAILLALALLRDWNACQQAVQDQRLGEPCGETLFGKYVLVLGFGNIAKELVPRLKAFGVTVSCVRRSEWTDADLVSPLS